MGAGRRFIHVLFRAQARAESDCSERSFGHLYPRGEGHMSQGGFATAAPEYFLGVTLIELLVTLAIIAILAAIAAPSFSDFIAKSRVEGRAGEMVSIFNLARSEALRRGATVSVCKSQNGTSCTTTGDWNQSVLVFSDVNKNGALDGVSPNADQLIRVLGAVPAIASISGGTNFSNWLSYDANGSSKGNGGLSNGTFIFVCTAAVIYKVAIGPTGRSRIEKESC